MIICKWPDHPDDHLPNSNNNNSNKNQEMGQKEEKEVKKFLQTDGRVDQTKEVQEVLADLKSGNELD